MNFRIIPRPKPRKKKRRKKKASDKITLSFTKRMIQYLWILTNKSDDLMYTHLDESEQAEIDRLHIFNSSNQEMSVAYKTWGKLDDTVQKYLPEWKTPS